MQSGTTRTRRSTNARNAEHQSSRAARPGAGGGFAESVAGSCTIIRNGRKSSRRIINRPFRSARIAEKTFSQNGVPVCSAASAATLAVSSGGQITGKQIHPWRKSPCGANAAGRRCARIRKSIAAVPLLSQSHGGNTPSADMRVVRGRVFNLCRGRTPILLPELCQRRTDRAKEFSQRHPQDPEYRTGKLDRAYQAGSARSRAGS